MISKNQNTTFLAIGISVIIALLAMPLAGIGPSEALAQGNNTTNATSASGTGEGQVTVVMPAGSLDPNSGTGYNPDPVTVSAGGTIIWDNQDNALHTATSGDPETATPDGQFDTGLVGAMQQSQPITIPTEPGEYTYFCTLHPYLVGTVTVQ